MLSFSTTSSASIVFCRFVDLIKLDRQHLGALNQSTVPDNKTFFSSKFFLLPF